ACLVPGHEIVGTIESVGIEVTQLAVGDRVGVPWLCWTCGACVYCRSGRENLCDRARFTGYTIDGGYAEYTTADARYCFRLPGNYSDIASAPRPTLRCKSRDTADRTSLRSPNPATLRVRPSPGRWARRGQAAPTKGRPNRSTRRCCSHRSGRLFLWRLRRPRRAARSCAPASI